MSLPPSPDSRELLPPILACLPTAFVSQRPPPALLPLLAPILRQRVNFLAGTTAPSDGWLPLLSWDAKRGSRLSPAVQSMNLEPHPVSGELEFEEVRPAKYRRLDKETLQCRLEVEQFDLLPIFVWCEKDEHGGTNPGWKLAELRTMGDIDDGTDWFDSAATAHVPSKDSAVPQMNIPPDEPSTQDDEDDDYWAAYDRTPSRTPGRTPAKRSPAPVPSSTFQMTSRADPKAEADYYARYGEEVQPAMDGHDPDEDHEELGESTLNGEALAATSRENEDYYASLQPHDSWKGDQTLHDSAHATSEERSPTFDDNRLSMPRPISAASSHSSVDKLEEKAEAMSAGRVSNDAAQHAVKQHISTDVKSLYRLAKASGMDRAEFERIVQRELEVLSFMDEDD